MSRDKKEIKSTAMSTFDYSSETKDKCRKQRKNPISLESNKKLFKQERAEVVGQTPTLLDQKKQDL